MTHLLEDSDILLEKMQDDGGYGDIKCDSCSHYNCWQEDHPYGMTTAAETLCECRVDAPEECPAYQAYIEELYAQVEAARRAFK